MAKLLQEAKEEPSALTRRINQLVELHENREQVEVKFPNYQQKMKSLFEEKAKDRPLQPEDLVLWWDIQREEKGKHKCLIPFGSALSKFQNKNEIILTYSKI